MLNNKKFMLLIVIIKLKLKSIILQTSLDSTTSLILMMINISILMNNFIFLKDNKSHNHRAKKLPLRLSQHLM